MIPKTTTSRQYSYAAAQQQRVCIPGHVHMHVKQQSARSAVVTGAFGNKDSPGLISLQNTYKNRAQVTSSSEPGTSLDDYMQRLRHYITTFPLPLGAKLLEKPGSNNTMFSLTTPKLQIFDFWIQPTAECTLIESPGILRLASTNASFRGSDTVERLGNSGALSADLRVEVAFKWPMLAKGSGSSTDCAVESDAAMTIKVALPMPFSLLPKPLVESTGNAALATVTPLLMSAFISAMVKDYETWSASADVREQRARDLERGTAANTAEPVASV